MNRFIRSAAPAAIAAIAVAGMTAVRADDAGAASPNAYVATPLVSNKTGAKFTDAHLQNAWGVAFSPSGSPFWISDNNAGVSTLYTGNGAPFPAPPAPQLVVAIPCPPTPGQGSSCPKGPAGPTGIVWNPSSAFLVPGQTTPMQASFIFDTEDGTISAWAGGLAKNPDDAVIAVDNSVAPSKKLGAVYKGLAFGVNVNSGPLLFATNFRAGMVEAYGPAPSGSTTGFYVPVTTSGGFVDKGTPKIPGGYAPFGIQNIDGNLIVTYAKQDASKHDDEPVGGYVDAFDTDGNFLQRLASNGGLSAPWGVARASYAFGPFSGDLLIGNFGNGWIYGLTSTGPVLLTTSADGPLSIPGLWNLGLGGGKMSNPSTLYYTAGPTHETDGRFGTITPAGTSSSTGWSN
jgi:uncharacterized protein (TIGR03118 family)